jgi:DNA-binding transcriptional ArsR family regulator
VADKADPVRLDVQSLSDTTVMIYEAIATLEFSGQRPSRRNIAGATSLSQPSLDEHLTDMTRRGLLRTTDEKADDGPVYIPAQRGWSAAPEQAEGHRMS